MRFGKSYAEVLEDPTFPEEWRKGAIEYNKVRRHTHTQLKKLLRMVTEELESVNLKPEVVSELLDAGMYHEQPSSSSQEVAVYSTEPASVTGQRATPSMLLRTMPTAPDAGASQEPSPAAAWLATLPDDHKYRKQRRKTRKRSYSTGTSPVLHTAENSPNTFVLETKHDSPVQSTSSPRRYSTGRISPLRQTSESEQLPPLMLPSGSESPRNPLLNKSVRPSAPFLPPPQKPVAGQDERDWNASHWKDQKVPTVFPEDARSFVSLQQEEAVTSHSGWVELESGRRAWAEYQMLNESLHLHPQLVVHVESPDTLSNQTSPDSQRGADTPRMARTGSRDLASSASTTNSPTVALTKRARNLSLNEISLGPAAKEIPTISSPKVFKEKKTEPPPPTGFHHRRIVIPLHADERFFESLSAALRKLLQLHVMQQAALVRHVNALRDTIALVASPENSPKDLYRWREVFTLWIEHDIFESSREKDRGELSVAASEQRLRKYLGELEKRGYLAPHRSLVLERKRAPSKLYAWDFDEYTQTNPMQDARSVKALEHFLRLNVALLSLKRFQRVNIETVRKILKKHEKKTALHAHQALGRMMVKMQPNSMVRAASTDSPLPDLDWDTVSHADILQSLSALVPTSLSTTTQLSLPRILASILTKSLLPVLPSVDDYSCLVCTGLAYQPIRLRCDHIFCIRCLVKLQKRGDNHCPLCRAENAVLDADGDNVDYEMAEYLRTWFPQEVEEKIRENQSDRVLEDRCEVEIRRKKRFGALRRRNRGGDGNQDCVIA